MADNLDIIIFGASGNLAKKKVFPAFFSLYSRGLLPKNTRFLGYARTKMTLSEFKNNILENLTCRYAPEHSCNNYIDGFLDKCFYTNGSYDSKENLKHFLVKDQKKRVNRLFYLAVPPVLFSVIAHSIADAKLIYSLSEKQWSRIIIEKPFGRDRYSSDKLNTSLEQCFCENQIYRIDHYLGKEVVQNILVFRFANIIFQPVWNSDYVEKIQINWSEKKGLEGRGGYFDNYGIIRDVIQNHLLQILALITMEPPDNLNSNEIRDKKVDLLRQIQLPDMKDVLVGQYVSPLDPQSQAQAYTKEEGVNPKSNTPTYAFVNLKISNTRWKNVPIEISAGKALDSHKAEVIITFKKPHGNIFCTTGKCPPANKLVMRIQPDEGMHFTVSTKVPGRKMEIQSKELNLSYTSAFCNDILPDAYENLLLDAINGDRTLFIRNDELQALWDILTPLLHELEVNKIKPIPYPFGSKGPHLKKNEKGNVLE